MFNNICDIGSPICDMYDIQCVTIKFLVEKSIGSMDEKGCLRLHCVTRKGEKYAK